MSNLCHTFQKLRITDSNQIKRSNTFEWRGQRKVNSVPLYSDQLFWQNGLNKGTSKLKTEILLLFIMAITL